MRLLHSRAIIVAQIFMIAASLLVVYLFDLAEANEYMGYRIFSVDLSYLLIVIVAVTFVGFVVPVNVKKPSDFFAMLYGLFVLLPYVVLFPIRRSTSFDEFLLVFGVLFLPQLCLILLSHIRAGIRFPVLMKVDHAIKLVSFICICGVFWALMNATPSAGFDMGTSYIRRIEGRDIYQTGSLIAYLNMAIVNSIAPMLAFVAGWKRIRYTLIISIFAGISYYYLLGLKAPIVLIIGGYCLGYLYRVGMFGWLANFVYLFLILLFFVSGIELLLNDYSYISDYFIRRAFTVPAWLISAYFDFFGEARGEGWRLIGGVSSDSPVTFLVGEEFLGYPGLNANTNAFVYALASGGLIIYLLTVLLVIAVFWVLDCTYKSRGNAVTIYLGFAFSVLLTEQAATTILVSSGIGFLVAIFAFTKIHNKRMAGFQQEFNSSSSI